MKCLLWIMLSFSFNSIVVADEKVELNDFSQNIEESSDVTLPDSATASLVRPNQLSLFYTAASNRFEQSGSGQTYKSDPGTGSGLFSVFEREMQNGDFLEIKGWYHLANFSEPSEIGGKDVGVERSLLSLLYSWQTEGEKFKWHYQAGLSSFSQDPGNFSSGNKLSSHYLSIGPSVGGGFKWNVNKTWTLKLNAVASLPIFFKEYGSKSGYHDLSYHYLLSNLVFVRLNRFLSFSFGVIGESETHRFNGEGDRNVEDAELSYFSIAIPIGLVYDF